MEFQIKSDAQITVLNYITGEVELIKIDNTLEQNNEAIEEYLENIGFALDSINWMYYPEGITVIQNN
jgi:hypothetical protein